MKYFSDDVAARKKASTVIANWIQNEKWENVEVQVRGTSFDQPTAGRVAGKRTLGRLGWQMDVSDFSASAVVAEGVAAAAKMMTVALQLVKVDSEADGSMTGLPVYLRILSEVFGAYWICAVVR